MTKTQLLEVLSSFANKFADKIESLFVKKESGKGLSSNDFTNDLKTKLDGVEEGANKTVVDTNLSSTSTNPLQNKAILAALNMKAEAHHAHVFAELTNRPSTIEGYGITDAETKGAADTALTNAKSYTDQKVADLINGAPTTLDTLKEIADAMDANDTVVDALEKSIGSKANSSDLDTHTGDSTIHITSTERTNWADANTKKHSHSNKSILDATTASYTVEEKEKLANLSASMEEITDEDIDAIIAGTFTE
jgi:hypothetical protein